MENSVESLIRLWGMWEDHERLRRRRANLQRREIIEAILDFYDWAWNPRYSAMIDASIVTEEDVAA